MGQVLTSNVDATAPSTNVTVASNTTAVIKPTRGRLFGVTVTAAGSGASAFTITDGVGGTAIFALPATTQAAGYYPIQGGNVFYTSCNVAALASGPAIVAHIA